MDLREIKRLVSLMNENGLGRLEIEEDGRRVLLEKAGHGVAAAPQMMAPAHPGYAMPMPMAAPAAAPAAAAPAPARAEGTITFNSPMVGTFYRASSPDAPAFVQAGSRVTQDTLLCLIEAMKVFNEIKAEMSGTIVEVLAENQEAVEYNQPLFIIKPD